MNPFSIFLLGLVSLQLRGSKELLTKEAPMQGAEMTAFTNISSALSTHIG